MLLKLCRNIRSACPIKFNGTSIQENILNHVHQSGEFSNISDKSNRFISALLELHERASEVIKALEKLLILLKPVIFCSRQSESFKSHLIEQTIEL